MSLAQVATIAETKARRTRRQLSDSGQLSVMVLVFVGLLSFGLVAPGERGMYRLGQLAAAGQWETVERTVTDGFVVGTLGLLALGTFRSAVATGQFDDKEALRAVTIRLRTQVMGKIVSEWLLYPAMLFVPLLIGAAAFGIGAGPLAAVTVFLVAVNAALTITSLSYPVGVGFVYLLERFDLSKRGRILAGLVGLGLGESLVVYRETVVQHITVPPMTWFGEVALAPTPATDPGLLPITAVASAPLVALVVAVRSTEWMVSYVWFRASIGERETHADDEEATGGHSVPLLPLDRVAPVADPTTALADLTVRRVLREPASLVRGAIAVVVVGLIGRQTLQTATPDAVFPPTAVVIVATVSGIGPLLNPLGNDGDALPILFGSGLDAEAYVRGKLVAGYVLTVPVVLGTVVVSLVFAGVSTPAYLVTTLLLAVVAALAIPAVAIGIGCQFPKIDRDTVLRGRRLVRANNVAVVTFSLLTMLLLASGMGAAIVLGLPDRQFSPGQFSPGILAGSIAVSLTGLTVAAIVGHRAAVSGVRNVSVDGNS